VESVPNGGYRRLKGKIKGRYSIFEMPNPIERELSGSPIAERSTHMTGYALFSLPISLLLSLPGAFTNAAVL
jgi:hypothetical protein